MGSVKSMWQTILDEIYTNEEKYNRRPTGITFSKSAFRQVTEELIFKRISDHMSVNKQDPTFYGLPVVIDHKLIKEDFIIHYEVNK